MDHGFIKPGQKEIGDFVLTPYITIFVLCFTILWTEGGSVCDNFLSSHLVFSCNYDHEILYLE